MKQLDFQAKVYNIVRKIPKGKVLTYKQVAQKSNFPLAHRAVGNALAKNKNPQIPCHRVIRSNGEIGGYNQGRKIKVLLLQKEGFDKKLLNSQR